MFHLFGCAAKALAQLDASITVDGLGIRATVRFTDFSPNLEGEKLRLSFSNPEGDTMDFLLSPVNGSFPVQSYSLDGSTNTFNASIKVVSELQPITVNLTTTTGFINLNQVNTTSDGFLESVTGDFRMNFETGGAGQGSFNTASN